jgi:tetratricopeptide (TPR) repeat protein
MKKILMSMLFLVSLIPCVSSPAWAGPQEDFSAGVIAFNQGRTDEAIRLFTKVIESSDLRYSKSYTAYYNRGICWLRKKNYDKAIADFNMAIEIKPDYSQAITARDRALVQQRKAASGP